MHLTTDNRKQTLLIVDDESSVCRALSRMLAGKADELTYATNALEAEMILKSQKITHILCDHWLGPGQTVGIDLVTKWRRMYPSIERAVLLTGTDVSKLKSTDEVDLIMTKVANSQDLVAALGLGSS